MPLRVTLSVRRKGDMRFVHNQYPKVGVAQIHKEEVSRWGMSDEGEDDEETSEVGIMDDAYFDEDNPALYSSPHRIMRY